MAIDAAMLDAMLGSFRDLLATTAAQGRRGPDVDEMASALADMEALGRQLSDPGEYSTRLANEGYYQRFTDAYTRAMLAAAGTPGASGGSGDPGGSGAGALPDYATLLANALGAYQQSLDHLRDVEGQDAAITALERILAVGRSGATYPVFLTRLENERLSDVLAGSAAPAREHLVTALEHHRGVVDPARAAESEALLAAYDGLAATSPTGSIDPFAFELRRFRIAWQHAPAIARRDAVVTRVRILLDLVIDWLDAHTTWGPRDQRFRGPSPAVTARRIAMTRECNPGFYAVRAAQFAEAFGPEPWWTRNELTEERRAGRILWSEPRVQLALDAIGACVPLASAPPRLVLRAETFGPDSF